MHPTMKDAEEVIALRARVAELEDAAANWRGNYIMLANTVNPSEDKPAIEAAQALHARIEELEMVLRTWKNMMANPNYDLGEMASEFNAIVHQVLP